MHASQYGRCRRSIDILPERYGTLDASGITGSTLSGTGTAGIATLVGPHEIIRLINYAEGTVSSAYTAFKVSLALPLMLVALPTVSFALGY